MRKPERRLKNKSKTGSDKLKEAKDLDTDKYLEDLRKKLVVEQSPKPTAKPKKLPIILGVIILIMLLLLALRPSLIGFITAGKELSFNDSINLDFASNAEYIWNVNNQGDIRSIKLFGQYENSTIARIYIENDNVKYLILDTSKLNKTESISPITGLVIKEEKDKDKDKDKKEKENKTEEAPVNETIPVNEIINQTQPVNETPATNGTLPEINVTLPLNETINITPIINGTTANQTINDTLAINETLPVNATLPVNETINITPVINETIQNITQPINKSISINLEYKADTAYDADNNGIEPITGIIDFTVENSQFNWQKEDLNLCTRWEVYSVDAEKSTSVCHGSSECCALVNLEPSRELWNEPLYLSYNLLGASYNNIVSARVIYANGTDIGLSSWANLTAKFEEIGLLKFENICVDTCSLSGFNKSSYKLVVEVDSGRIVLDRINYIVRKKFANNAPELLKSVGNYSIRQGASLAINLSDYFYDKDGDLLSYSYYKDNNFNIKIENNIATITPVKIFSGSLYTFFVANDSESIAVSNVFSVNVTKAEGLQQLNAEINKPVPWVKKFLSDRLGELRVAIPESAFNISVYSVDNEAKVKLSSDKIKVDDEGNVKSLEDYELNKSIEKIIKKINKEKSKKEIDLEDIEELESELNKLLLQYSPQIIENTTINETQVVISDNSTEFEVGFSTEAPEVIEEEKNEFTKLITISSELSYENVLAYTAVKDAPQNAVKLYWIKEGVKELFTDVTYKDNNANGLVDYIEWIVPHLSNQTFEVSIVVLNLHSYPILFGNWTVEFNTTGTGNLTIKPFNGTSYAEVPDNSSTTNDLEYLETRCSAAVLNTSIVCSNGELMPYEAYKIKKRIAEIKKRLAELNQTG